MRHRLANKSLSRPTAHRLLMLRNLVYSLIEHEQITTTVAKAKEAQKMAEKVISIAKRGGQSGWDRANSILLNPKTTLRPLFTTLVPRYASRPGGYTRLTLAGHRVGDHAPLAVLELVDSPNDLKFESAARIVGREMAVRAQEGAGPTGWWDWQNRVLGRTGKVEELLADSEGQEGKAATVEKEVDVEAALDRLGYSIELDPLTRQNVLKALRYRSTSSELTLFLTRSHYHYLRSLSQLRLSTAPQPDPSRPVTQLTQRIRPSLFRGAPEQVVTVPVSGRRAKAGERTDGWASTVEEGQIGVEAGKRGGPITRAKGSLGRYWRRENGAREKEESA